MAREIRKRRRRKRRAWSQRLVRSLDFTQRRPLSLWTVIILIVIVAAAVSLTMLYAQGG